MAAAGLTTGIPESIRTSVYQGKTYFQGLPPHLQTRFYFAPLESASGSLVLTGGKQAHRDNWQRSMGGPAHLPQRGETNLRFAG
jgi:hypothetical protein